MNLFEYAIAGAGGLIVLSATGTTGYILAAESVRRLARRKATRDLRNHPAYPPPLPGADIPGWRIFPTVTQADIDAAWLDAWPQDDAAEQERYDRLFDDIVALEGWR